VTPRPSSRQVEAIEALGIRPDDRVLELGCGHGVAAGLVCERLTTGYLVALDRSQTMIEVATKRNAEHVASGRARFVCTALEDADFGDERFDKIFGIHFPPALRHDPEGTRRLVERLLAPGGSAHFF
jgi:ubiquinone/menaquinone biosynthesis C-methylase UbiE